MGTRAPSSDSRTGRDPRSRLTLDAGLCRACIHLEVLDSGRSVFVYCGLSRTDPRFPRYPPLPVLACDGFERESEAPGPAPGS